MPNTPYPLGRRQFHDPRNLNYAIGVLPKGALVKQDWTRRVPIFDQESLGSCTGNAAIGLVGTDAKGYIGRTSVTVTQQAQVTVDDRRRGLTGGEYTLTTTVPVDEALAVKCYSLATKLDSFSGSYPPDDTGSDGPSAAKALTKFGLAGDYSHAFSLDAVKSALQSGAGMAGIKWLHSMFRTDNDGMIIVDRSSSVDGGHEFVVSAWDPDNARFRMDNSWAAGWGLNGSAWFHEADLAWLLSDGGDFTQPKFLKPAPPKVLTGQELFDKIKTIAKAGGLK